MGSWGYIFYFMCLEIFLRNSKRYFIYLKNKVNIHSNIYYISTVYTYNESTIAEDSREEEKECTV